MRIDVTAADIAAGLVCDSDACPVALALARATGRRWSVGKSSLQLLDPQPVRIETPAAVAAFVSGFDSFARMEPFSFELPDGLLE